MNVLITCFYLLKKVLQISFRYIKNIDSSDKKELIDFDNILLNTNCMIDNILLNTKKLSGIRY